MIDDATLTEWLLNQTEQHLKELKRRDPDALKALLAELGFNKDAWWERAEGRPGHLADEYERREAKRKQEDAVWDSILATREPSKAACDAHTALWESLDAFSGKKPA